MQKPRRRIRSTLPLILLLALVMTATEILSGAAAQAGPPTQVTWSSSTARPFSDPVWYPLRNPAAVDCTYRNCSGSYHGYWALDLIGQLGDPIYAAGAGVFHVGAVDPSCKTARSEIAGGTWAWIDHGGGLVSRYQHLDSITARDGQLVTPSTQIGRMGHSGDVAPCTTNYLHFEVRRGGVGGTRIDPGQLRGCEGTALRSYPSALGYASWNDVPRASERTPQLDNGCLPSSAATTAAPGAITGRRADRSARVSWTAPPVGASTVRGYVLSREHWLPSIQVWSDPTYLTLPASQLATTVTGLDNGRRYRFHVLARNALGNSAWTPYQEIVPATVPQVPDTGRGLTASYDLVRFAWWKAVAQGTPVTSYTLAIRRRVGAGWSAWSYVTVTAGTFSYKFTGLRAGTTYQVTARADSGAGSSRYGTPRTITTARR